MDEQGKAIYQDVCYPVTKDFREKLYAEIERVYVEAKEKKQNQTKEQLNKLEIENKKGREGSIQIPIESLPFH